jgi:DNA-directed RNA polymerase specialized sigma24 family protein
MMRDTSMLIATLIRYTDPWQPATSSFYEVGAARRGPSHSDGMRPGLLETLDDRTELCRRMGELSERERRVLFLWYVRQLSAQEIAKELRISRRQCFRIRSAALRALQGETVDPEPEGADADETAA